MIERLKQTEGSTRLHLKTQGGREQANGRILYSGGQHLHESGKHKLYCYSKRSHTEEVNGNTYRESEWKYIRWEAEGRSVLRG